MIVRKLVLVFCLFCSVLLSAQITVPSNSITLGEYFWDTDPGEGNGTPLVAFDGNWDESIESVSESISSLLFNGYHTFNIRVKDADGVWSSIFSNVIYFDQLQSLSASDFDLTQGEYFWDTDPGEGNGTPLVAFDGNWDESIESVSESISSLLFNGYHTFNIRVKDADGVWSSIFSNVIYFDQLQSLSASDFDLTQGEYFWDTDPGEGNGTPLVAFDGNWDESIESVSESISSLLFNGYHTFNIRVKDADGVWSSIFSNVIYFNDPSIIYGCTDSAALNYDPLATLDDGSCSYPCLPDTSYTNITACDSVVWNGNTYNSSGTYTGSSVSNNYSASLDGINDYVDVGNNSVLDIDNSVTIEAWINPSNLSNRHAIYSTRKNNDPGSFQLEIGTYSAVGTNYVAVTGVGTWVAITGSNVINNNGGWVHIAYTRDGVGNNHEIYINGIPQIIYTNPYTFINNNSLKEIGRGTTAIQNYDGKIDQVRIWDIALTQLEIQNYMNCPPTGSESGLVGYWNFEEGSGTTAYDLTSNGNDGAINGATYDNNFPSQSCGLTNANGCDSTAVLNLTINNAVTTSNTVSICSGDSFTVGTSTYNIDGNYTDVLTTIDGCDSTVTTILTTDPLGCTDPSVFNYDPNAVCDDGSCIFPFSNLPDSISTCDSVQICVDSIAGGSYSWSTSNTSNSGNLAIGDTYQGGIVFWLDGNGGGLIAAPSDQSTETTWGCTASDISGADGTAIGTGNQNTIDIEAGCLTTGTAADLCANLTFGGYSDWFLPSKDELNQMYLNIGQASTLSNIGNFDNTVYWSSSEYNLHFAWCQSFLSGTPQYINKVVIIYNVRAIRAFTAPIIADTTNCIWVSNSGWNYITTTTTNGLTATDSVYVLNTSASDSSSVSACNTYTWEGQTITSSGNLTHTYQSVLGCDSVHTLSVTINSSTTNTTTITDCDSYTWSVNGTTYTQSGTYTNVSTNASGCTHTETLVLTINNSTTNTTTITDCDSYAWSVNGTAYTQSGTYTDVSTNASGCTHTETLVLTINSSTSNTTTVTDCDSYTWSVNGTTYTSSGTYTDISTNASGCTHTETLVLTINNSTSNTTTITDCDSYTWSVNGTTYTQSGTYTDVSTNASGCIETEILVLTINSSTSNTTTVTNCDSYTWSVNGTTYTQSGTYTDVSTNSSGCTDTEVLVLTINNSTTNTTTITDCDSYAWSVNGTTYTQSGTYTDVSTNSSGCTDTEILVLTINNSTTNTTTITDCDSYAWSVNGTTYTQSGTYTDVSTNSSGCTDTEVLVLTINNSTTNTTTITDCDSYAWSVNGTTYTQSGTYTDVSTNASGCTHTETLVLTINSSTSNTTTVTDCDSYTWSVNGTTYTSSGTYTDISTNASGCTHTETLVLTINNSTSNTTTITDCDSYTWSVNGTTYTQSGTYTAVSTNSSGCIDTEILVLTINNSTTNTTTITDCDSYTWSVNGTTYTQSGTYTDVSTNSSGCTDTENLVLIINNTISLTNTVSICFGDSITLGSNTYSQTGIYTDVFTAVNGCDSIITTNLNVSQQIIAIISQLGMDINVNPTGGNMPYVYEWNTGETSQTITPNQDGDYWVIVTDANGCLSNTSFFVVDWILTSIEHFNIDRLSIYPNPSRNIFNIEFTSLLRQNLEIRIINSIGEIVYLENLKNYTGEYNKAINLKEFSKALYFLEITTNDGIINKKLILQ